MNPKTKLLSLVTPGEMIVEEFLKPLGLTEYRLAKTSGSRRAASMESWMRVRHHQGCSVPPLAILQKHLAVLPNLQADYELRRIEREDELPKIARCTARRGLSRL